MAAITVLYAPVHLIALFMFMLSAGRYDNTGRGGVFRACTPASTSCSGPEVGVMVVCALIIVAGLALAGAAGQRVGRFPHPWRARLGLAAASAVPVALAVGLMWPR